MNHSQEENTPLVKKLSQGVLDKLWDRIVEAFAVKTQDELANKLNLSPSALTKWKKKGGRPSLETLVAISRLTNSSLHWLITGEGDKSINKATQGNEPAPLPFALVTHQQFIQETKQLAAAYHLLTSTQVLESPQGEATFMVNVSQLRQSAIEEVTIFQLSEVFQQDGWPTKTLVACVPAALADLRDGDRCIVRWRGEYRARIYRTHTDESCILEHMLGDRPPLWAMLRDVVVCWRIIDSAS